MPSKRLSGRGEGVVVVEVGVSLGLKRVGVKASSI